MSTGESEGRGRKGTKVGRTEGGERDRRSGLSVGLGLDRWESNEISELSSYYIPAQYLYVVGNPARTIRDVRDRKEENEIRRYVPGDKF